MGTGKGYELTQEKAGNRNATKNILQIYRPEIKRNIQIQIIIQPDRRLF
jgi:hypothetical protein